MTSDDTAGIRGRRVREEHRRLSRAFALTALGTVVPGAGLVRTRWRQVGWILVGAFAVGLLALLAAVIAKGPSGFALSLAARPTAFQVLAIGSLVAGFVWCGSILATAWIAHPHGITRSQGTALGAFAAAMAVLVAIPIWWVQGASFATDRTLSTVFTGSSTPRPSTAISVATEASDPWHGIPRVNVLLLGSDAGVDRDGTRTDSMMVASIDTATGNTVLFGLPRNLQRVPFPVTNPLHKLYPNGFTCPDRVAREGVGATCMLNGVWTEATQTHPELFTDPKTAGRETTRDVIGEILGLRIDYTVVVDLQGFQQLVDAMGGVDINVRTTEVITAHGWPGVPVETHFQEGTGRLLNVPSLTDAAKWVPLGQQHLDGYHALWYARSRVIDTLGDFGRMARQRCVASAIMRQANVPGLVRNYQGILAAARNNIWSDISTDELPAFVMLFERVQKGKITSLPFTTDVIDTWKPNFAKIRTLVAAAIAPKPTASVTGGGTTKPSSPVPSTTASRSPSRPSNTTSVPTPTTIPPTAQSVEDAC